MGNHAVAVKAIVRSQNQFALMLDLCVKSEPRIVQGTWSGKEALQGPGRFCIDGHLSTATPIRRNLAPNRGSRILGSMTLVPLSYARGLI